jgi:hypothetical protein
MNRLITVFLVSVVVSAAQAIVAQQPKAQPTPEPEPEPLVEAKKHEIWSLGDQEWDFKDVATAYMPVKGALNAKTGAAEWTLEIVKELAPGEVGVHESTEGSPFKVVLLDGEKIVLAVEPRVRLASKLTGKPGDKVKVVLQLPKAEALSQAKFVRIERRTKVGF